MAAIRSSKSSPLPDIFLSYNREDQAVARRFAEAFAAAGLDVWWDSTLRAGEAYDQVTEKALKTAKAVVVLWSKRSVESRWVRAEATLADRQKTLVPVTIEPCERPIMFELTQTAELSHWDGEPTDTAWLAFLADVKRFVDKSRPESHTPAHAPSDVSAGEGPRPAGGADEAISIAVLPFVNMSSDPEQEYFSDGLAEELLNQLSQIKTLRVAGRTSSFAFKGKTDDLRLIGAKLGVNHVLEGSVRKAGNRLRITAQLIKCSDGFHLWSQTYDRELDDVFAIQDEVAREVTQALGVTLGVGETVFAPGGTRNVAAYDLYLRAQAQFTQMGPASVTRAAELYRQALELDPQFALAWSGLGHALVFSQLLVPETMVAAREEMERAYDRVLAIAPDLWSGHAARATLAQARWDWQGAETAVLKALDLSSGTEVAPRQMRSQFLVMVGRAEEGAQMARAACAAEPLSLGQSFFLQIALDLAGRPDQAEAEYRRSEDLSGDRGSVDWYGVVRMWDQPERYKARFFAAFSDDNSYMPVHRKLVDVVDAPDKALALIREAYGEPFYQDGPRTGILAEWAAYYGDRDFALTALRRSVIELRSQTGMILWLPMFRTLRQDLRFKEIVRDRGYVDYWRATGHWGDHVRPIGDDDFEIIG